MNELSKKQCLNKRVPIIMINCKKYVGIIQNLLSRK